MGAAVSALHQAGTQGRRMRRGTRRLRVAAPPRPRPQRKQGGQSRPRGALATAGHPGPHRAQRGLNGHGWYCYRPGPSWAHASTPVSAGLPRGRSQSARRPITAGPAPLWSPEKAVVRVRLHIMQACIDSTAGLSMHNKYCRSQVHCSLHACGLLLA